MKLAGILGGIPKCVGIFWGFEVRVAAESL